MNATRERVVGRKKSQQPREGGPRRYGTQIRVSGIFADLIVSAANTEKLSVADYIDKHLTSLVEKRYRDAVIREAKRLTEGGK